MRVPESLALAKLSNRARCRLAAIRDAKYSCAGVANFGGGGMVGVVALVVGDDDDCVGVFLANLAVVCSRAALVNAMLSSKAR